MLSQTLAIYQVDAFASRLFTGNPAAVCPLNEWLSDDLLQNIAIENNLSETAFFVPEAGCFHLRWFTPGTEVDLCGHATLAAAHVLFEHLSYPFQHIEFQSRSGKLIVSREGDQYILNFPADQAKLIEDTPEWLSYFGVTPQAIYKGKDDFLLVLENQSAIENLKPNFSELRQVIGGRGFIATAPGNEHDFVSRCFYGPAGIDEDPVTGSAHTLMTPYWSSKLGKKTLYAAQLSTRGGALVCTLKGDRVLIKGKGKTYMMGHIFL